MKEKTVKKQENIIINIFFDEKGKSILEILELDFSDFANKYLKLKMI